MTRFVYVLPAGRLRWEVRYKRGSALRDRIRELADQWDGEGIHGDDDGGPLYVCDHEARFIIGQLRDLIGERPPPPVSQFYRRKAHALIAARAIAIVVGGEVQPHNRWGRIQDPDSYGNDPMETKG